MKNEGWKVKVEQDMLGIATKVWIFHVRNSETVEVVQGEVIQHFPMGGADIPPSFVVPQEAWQSVVDAISDQFKPSEGKFTEGKLEAVEAHLGDLRALVFPNHLEPKK